MELTAWRFLGLLSLFMAAIAISTSMLTTRRLRNRLALSEERISALSLAVRRLETLLSVGVSQPAGINSPAETATFRRKPRPDERRSTPFTGPTLISLPDLAPSSGPLSNSESGAELGRRFARVWELADAGQSAEAIARSIGQPAGQVELILGLRRQVASTVETHCAGGPPS